MHLDVWTLALQTVNFAVLIVLLQRFLYRPVLRMIDARRDAVQKQTADAEALAAQARAQLAGIEAQRTAVAAERDALLRSARQQAEQLAATRRAQAEADANALLAATRTQLAAERAEALAALRANAQDLAQAMALKLWAELPRTQRLAGWAERVLSALQQLPEQQLGELRAEVATGAAVEVTTAEPLPEEIAGQLLGRLRALLGQDLQATWRTDARLLAGGELQFPQTLLRFAWPQLLPALSAETAHADAG